jgi:tight adherence protein B
VGAFLGLLVGLGILLVWHGLSTHPQRPVRRRARSDRTREHLIQAGLPGVSPAQLIGLQVLAGMLIAIIGLTLTQSLSVTAIFALFAAAVPRMVVSRLRHKRQADLRELWPEVVDNLTSGVRAGLSLPEALAAIGTRGPEQLREPFRQFGSDYRTTGRFNDSLDRLKAALADPVGDRVCESLRVAREVGGTDLGRLLSTLSGFLRDDARTRAELLARQSWSVNAARMAVAAPWLVLLLLATQRETLQAYDTPTGTVILAAGAALSLLAYRLMVRIGRLPEDRRVLR